MEIELFIVLFFLILTLILIKCTILAWVNIETNEESFQFF
jgi:hypothetical protein